MNQIVLKQHVRDFLVVEGLVVPHCEDETVARYSYVRVRKAGYTTFEAIEKIGTHLDLGRECIQAAGLKDEDAITEQMVSIEQRITPDNLVAFNEAFDCDEDRFIQLDLHSVGDEPLGIGRLSGNTFRLRVRNLPRRVIDNLERASRHTFYFLNYYDEQRFGVPHAPKTTHLIGEAILQNDYARALDILRLAKTPESTKAKAFEGAPAAFFEALDPRVVNFFKSACASSIWNAELAGVVRSVCGNSIRLVEWSDLPFVLAPRQSDVLSVLNARPQIDYQRYYGDGTPGKRASVIQVQIHHDEIAEDEDFSGAYSCSLSFFLQSGSYATMCVKQLAETADLVA